MPQVPAGARPTNYNADTRLMSVPTVDSSGQVIDSTQPAYSTPVSAPTGSTGASGGTDISGALSSVGAALTGVAPAAGAALGGAQGNVATPNLLDTNAVPLPNASDTNGTTVAPTAIKVQGK